MPTPSIVLRVLLDSPEKENVYRDIQINRTDNFESLRVAILSAFGFSGTEIGSFQVVDNDWNAVENEQFEGAYGDELPTLEIQQEIFANDSNDKHMGNVRIQDILTQVDDKILFTYDLLINWRFLIVALAEQEDSAPKPTLLFSHGTAPAESSKGVDMEFSNLSRNEKGTQSADFDDDDDDDEFKDGWMDEYESDEY